MFGYPDQQKRGKRSAPRMQPRLEGLEDRVVLSTFQVNTTLDTVAVNLGNGKDATGHISLRSAIMAADAKGAPTRSSCPRGTFTLTIAGAGEDASATGDLDITGNLTIKGKGSASTIIDGNNLDRVFQVLGGKVSISKRDDPARPRRRRRRRDPEHRRPGDALLGRIVNNVAARR